MSNFNTQEILEYAKIFDTKIRMKHMLNMNHLISRIISQNDVINIDNESSETRVSTFDK